MSLGKYRAIDLSFLMFIACGLDAIMLFAKSKFPPMIYFWLSISMAVSLIAIIRWNWWGLIPAVFSACFYILFSNYAMGVLLTVSVEGTMAKSLTSYALGTLFIAVEMLYLRLVKKERVCSNGWLLILYAVIAFLAVALGRAVVSVFFGENFIISLAGYLQVDSLNLVWTIIILFITNKQDGMLFDQKEYFLEVRGRR